MPRLIRRTIDLTFDLHLKNIDKPLRRYWLIVELLRHLISWYYTFYHSVQSKKDRKDQESIQSRTTHVPGYQMGK